VGRRQQAQHRQAPRPTPWRGAGAGSCPAKKWSPGSLVTRARALILRRNVRRDAHGRGEGERERESVEVKKKTRRCLRHTRRPATPPPHTPTLPPRTAHSNVDPTITNCYTFAFFSFLISRRPPSPAAAPGWKRLSPRAPPAPPTRLWPPSPPPPLNVPPPRPPGLEWEWTAAGAVR